MPLLQPLALAAALCLALPAAPARAAGGKLLLTGGVSSIDGAAGGGLTPWALTGSYATGREVGATAFATRVRTSDYALSVVGAAVGFGDRAELSLARQDFATGDNLAPLGLAGLHLKMNVIGAKLRLAGDAVLDSDSAMPQIAIGLLHKRVDAGALAPTLTGPLGASDSGTDVYLSATKLFLAQGVLVNGTLRATKANQNGLLGFGSATQSGYRVQPELSLALLLRRDLAIGVEYRAKPDNLNESVLGAGALKEDDWADLFLAWAPSKHLSLTLAWVDLGRIAPAVQPRRQRGAYLSAQAGF
ncbi:MAG: DUF3034 family protein [Piscinibacter sp.]